MVTTAAHEFDKIDSSLSDILGKLKLFRGYEDHFKPSASKSWDHLYNALANFYVDVIDFTLISAKRYRTGTMSMDR